MTESELLMHLQELATLQMQNTYWFLSVSFALYSAAYLIGKRIVLGTAIFIVTTYVLFLFLITNDLLAYFDLRASILADLIGLERNGSQLSNFSQKMIDLNGTENVALRFWIGGLFLPITALGGIGYLIFQYRQGRKESTVKLREDDT